MRISVLTALLAALQLPSAPNPYRPLDTWAQLPAGMEFGQVSGVDLDARGNVWVIHRADPPILEFDASGKLLKSFGSGMFVQAHSLHFDRDGNLWAVDGDGRDGKGNQVVKLDPSDGHVLLTLPTMFNRPADVVTSANGDVFVADGHVNSHIVKFAKGTDVILPSGSSSGARQACSFRPTTACTSPTTSRTPNGIQAGRPASASAVPQRDR